VKNKTDQIVGFVLGLIVIVICYYWFFEKTPDAPPQTDGTFSSMPAADRSGVAGIDEFRLCELQMSAVIIDMHRYLGWFPDEKEAMRTASIKAVSDLLSIKTFLNDCRFKRPHRTVAEQTLTAIDKLILLYDGIEKKDDEMLKIQQNTLPIEDLFRLTMRMIWTMMTRSSATVTVHCPLSWLL
jgi:hypothetical protein